MNLFEIIKLIWEGLTWKRSSGEVTAPTPHPNAPPKPLPSIGKVIVDHEARRDKNGNLAIYKLPANDGGGKYEAAGINDKYHPKALAELRAMAPEYRDAYAAEYIENYVRKGTGLTQPTGLRKGTLLFILDTAFNRGPGGAAWVVQDALIRLGYKIYHDRLWGNQTRSALLAEDFKKTDRLVVELWESRKRYEVEIVNPRHPAGSRDKFWNGMVNRWDKIATIANDWNKKEPVKPETKKKATKPRLSDPAPDYITLPRESNSSLNAFYGTANSSGSYLDWFSFPVDNMALYSRGGNGLKDRDGDGRDEHRCHSAIVDRLEAALQEIFYTLGKAEFERQGWNIYGGCFNYRKKTSGGSLSTHSWGIAIDINPDQNGWKQYSTTFSDAAINIMEKYGFLSAFRAWGHDAMHFQACIPSIKKNSYYGRNGLPKNIRTA